MNAYLIGAMGVTAVAAVLGPLVGGQRVSDEYKIARRKPIEIEELEKCQRCGLGRFRVDVDDVKGLYECDECGQRYLKGLQHHIFTHWTCPDCKVGHFLEGPSGGACTNVQCDNENCRSKFNVSPMGVERIRRSW